MSRWSTPGEIRVLEVTFSVFRAMKDSSCLRGYFNDNPWDIVRVLYRGKFLCYAISREAAFCLDTVLLDSGFDEEFVAKWIGLEVGLTCWRTGSPAIIQAVVCSGPSFSERAPFKVASVMPAQRSGISGSFYLVPPCVAFAIFGPLLYNKQWRAEQASLRLRAPKRRKFPTRVEELLREIAQLRQGLDQEGAKALDGIEAAVVGYVEVMEAVERERARVHESLEEYDCFRRGHEELELPRLSTTPKVIDIHISGRDGGEYYYLGRP